MTLQELASILVEEMDRDPKSFCYVGGIFPDGEVDVDGTLNVHSIAESLARRLNISLDSV